MGEWEGAYVSVNVGLTASMSVRTMVTVMVEAMVMVWAKVLGKGVHGW